MAPANQRMKLTGAAILVSRGMKILQRPRQLILIVRPVLRVLMGWEPFDGGSTVGRRGSEGGAIARDDEHDLGARITLERGCADAPVAITCGVYGWFFHTRFLGSEAEADFDRMEEGLDGIVDLIPRVDDPDGDRKSSRVCDAIAEFVARFP